MQGENKKIILNPSRAYYYSIGMYLFINVLSNTTISDKIWYSTLANIFNVTIILLLLYKIISQKYSLREIIYIVLFGLIVLLSYLFSGYVYLIWLYLFVISAQNVSFKKIAVQTIWVIIFSIILIMLISYLGLIEVVIITDYEREFLWSGNSTIYLGGFHHQNYLGGLLFITYCCYIFLRYDNFSWKDLITFAVFFYLCFFRISSRTAAIEIAFLTLLVIVFKLFNLSNNDKRKQFWAKFCTYGLMIFSIIFSIFLSINYNSNNRVYSFINSLLSTRISSAHNLYVQYGFSIFGQNINLVSTIQAKEEGTSSIILDNAYMHMLLHFGIFVTAIILIGYFVAVKYAFENGTYSIAILIATIFIYGISENLFFNISMNPFLILLSVGIFGEKIEVIDDINRFKHRRIKLVFIKRPNNRI